MGRVISEDRLKQLFSSNENLIEAESESREPKIDPEILRRAVEFGISKPSVSLFSPIVAAMLEYMRLTVPAFCKSDAGTREIEAIFRRRYPDLWKTIEREIVAMDTTKRRKARPYRVK